MLAGLDLAKVADAVCAGAPSLAISAMPRQTSRKAPDNRIFMNIPLLTGPVYLIFVHARVLVTADATMGDRLPAMHERRQGRDRPDIAERSVIDMRMTSP